jgi:hypothetical protein
MARWVFVQVFQTGWYRFWQDSRRLPSQVWQRWAGTLALGLGICAAITFGITLYAKGQIDQGLQAWDIRTLPIPAEKIPMSFSRAVT